MPFFDIDHRNSTDHCMGTAARARRCPGRPVVNVVVRGASVTCAEVSTDRVIPDGGRRAHLGPRRPGEIRGRV